MYYGIDGIFLKDFIFIKYISMEAQRGICVPRAGVMCGYEPPSQCDETWEPNSEPLQLQRNVLLSDGPFL